MAEDVLAAKQFKDSLELALQQRDSKFAARCMNSTYQGEGTRMLASLSAIEMQALTSKRDPIVPVETEWAQRWTAPSFWDLPLQLDRREEIMTFADPKSAMVEATRAAVERKKDRVVVDAFFGDALTGKSGTTTSTWASEGSGRVVAADFGNTGTASLLNTKKVREALTLLKEAEVDTQYEDVFMAASARQLNSLYDEAVIISKDYSADAFTRNDKGIITSFMGIQFIHTELLKTDGTYLRLPMWTRMGMDFGTWGSPMTNVYEDKAFRGHPWTVYTMQSFSAARRDPKRIVEIKCKVSA